MSTGGKRLNTQDKQSLEPNGEMTANMRILKIADILGDKDTSEPRPVSETPNNYTLCSRQRFDCEVLDATGVSYAHGINVTDLDGTVRLVMLRTDVPDATMHTLAKNELNAGCHAAEYSLTKGKKTYHFSIKTHNTLKYRNNPKSPCATIVCNTSNGSGVVKTVTRKIIRISNGFTNYLWCGKYLILFSALMPNTPKARETTDSDFCITVDLEDMRRTCGECSGAPLFMYGDILVSRVNGYVNNELTHAIRLKDMRNGACQQLTDLMYDPKFTVKVFVAALDGDVTIYKNVFHTGSKDKFAGVCKVFSFIDATRPECKRCDECFKKYGIQGGCVGKCHNEE